MIRTLSIVSALLFSNAALACTPGGWSIEAHLPEDGASDVPIDSRIVVWWRGYSGAETLSVSSGGVAVPGQLVYTPMPRTGEWAYGLVEFTPSSEWLPGQVVDVTVDGALYGPYGAESFQFTAGSGTTEPTSEAPDLGAVSLDEIPEDPYTTCDGDAYRQVSAEITPTSDADKNAWVAVFRADPTGAPAELYSIAGPARSVGAWSDRSKDLSRDAVEECFVAVQIDGSGAMSAASAVQCAPEVQPDGPAPASPIGEESGCSTAGSLALGWWIVLPVLGARRRR